MIGSGILELRLSQLWQLPRAWGLCRWEIFNEDGKADLVVATIAGAQQDCIVLLGKGDGLLSNRPLSEFLRILPCQGSRSKRRRPPGFGVAMNGTVAVSMGHGDGTFAATTQLSGTFPGTFWVIAVTDFNGDGKLDIAAFGFGLAQRRSRKTRFLCREW